MPIEIKSTSDVSANGIKCLVYGKAGVGKTTLLATAPNPIILSCESGLLSLSGVDVPYIKIESINDLMEAYEFVKDNDDYDTICLDSISEIAEVFLSHLKATSKDARQAYGDLADQCAKMMRKFRDIEGKNVVFVAKVVRNVDEDGIQLYQASMPGKNLINNIPYFFDEVMFMTFMHGDEDEEYRVIRTDTTYEFEAKDRSGKLKPVEKPDLTYIFNKISGDAPVEQKVESTPEEQEEAAQAEADAAGTEGDDAVAADIDDAESKDDWEG